MTPEITTFRQKSRAFLALRARQTELLTWATRVMCCACHRPTVWDDTHEDLCYRCIRADNE